MKKERKFSYNCIDLFLKDFPNKTEENNLIKLKDILSQEKEELDNESINNIILKKKLFLFLYHIFLDHIFLGNEFSFLTDLDIIWDNKIEKFFLKSNYFKIVKKIILKI